MEKLHYNINYDRNNIIIEIIAENKLHYSINCNIEYTIKEIMV